MTDLFYEGRILWWPYFMKLSFYDGAILWRSHFMMTLFYDGRILWSSLRSLEEWAKERTGVREGVSFSRARFFLCPLLPSYAGYFYDGLTGIAKHHGRCSKSDHLCQDGVGWTSTTKRRIFVKYAVEISYFPLFSSRDICLSNYRWKTVSLIH